EPSSLTKFRKLRLKDVNLLDMLINKTVEIAIEKEVIKCNSIIVDATHTKARYNQKSPKEILADRSKKLRKSVYEIDESMNIQYCKILMNVIDNEEAITRYRKLKEKLNLLKETVSDDIEHIRISEDKDAKIGHKTNDTSFFGYKTHIAMSEERIITAATVTT